MGMQFKFITMSYAGSHASKLPEDERDVPKPSSTRKKPKTRAAEDDVRNAEQQGAVSGGTPGVGVAHV